MMITRLVVAAVTLLLVATAGVAAIAADGEAGQLTGVEWALVSITSNGETSTVPEGVSANLKLEDGSAGGSGGCNTFFGSYELNGSSLSFGPIGATQMFCEGPAQQTEDAYLAALGTVAGWSIDADGMLQLVDADGAVVLTFRAPNDTIEGATWQLQTQAVDGAQEALPDGVSVTLHMADGTAAGSAGCNRYSGSYMIDGDGISFGNMMTTLRACSDPAATVESNYLANLGAVTNWSTGDGTLTLTNAEGETLLVYGAAAPASIEGDWVAQGINNGREAVVSSTTTSDVTATFAADGSLSGFDGCNQYSTTYAVDGDSITITDTFATTRMACASDELNAQANEYYAALAAATTWLIGDSGELQLRDADGALQVSYLPAGS